jgi:hypothetical protein
MDLNKRVQELKIRAARNGSFLLELKKQDSSTRIMVIYGKIYKEWLFNL